MSSALLGRGAIEDLIEASRRTKGSRCILDQLDESPDRLLGRGLPLPGCLLAGGALRLPRGLLVGGSGLSGDLRLRLELLGTEPLGLLADGRSRTGELLHGAPTPDAQEGVLVLGAHFLRPLLLLLRARDHEVREIMEHPRIAHFLPGPRLPGLRRLGLLRDDGVADQPVMTTSVPATPVWAVVVESTTVVTASAGRATLIVAAFGDISQGYSGHGALQGDGC